MYFDAIIYISTFGCLFMYLMPNGAKSTLKVHKEPQKLSQPWSTKKKEEICTKSQQNNSQNKTSVLNLSNVIYCSHITFTE